MFSHSAALVGLGVCSACARSRLFAIAPATDLEAPTNIENDAGSIPTEDLVDFGPNVPLRQQLPTESNEEAFIRDLNKEDLDIIDSETSRVLRHTPYTKKLSREEQYKILYPDREHLGDIFLEREKQEILKSVRHKIDEVQKFTGHGHFNLVGLDELYALGKKTPGNNDFTPTEKKFFEEFFHAEAAKYGFYGKKVITKMTDTIHKQDVFKVPYSGHYLFKDVSLPIFERIRNDIGQQIVLTSGVRGIAKQIHLFLAKIEKVNFNISQASRSLAPPGYSYHAVGDFDIGQRGLGELNFTKSFSGTSVYKRLKELGYIEIRYSTDNPFGVRFEPWHIEGGKRRV